MRLRRIEAVRYGAFEGATLGDLDDGLTVVLGPNEAGKSSYTALVRHVLYRYPTARDSEQGYSVDGKNRCARLVFDDPTGSWVVERIEGPHGGRVSVRTLHGPDRHDLLAELTRGVSELAYRTVFGFGLSDMAAIEEQRGSGDSVISLLYAASAGLRVSPQQVRAAVEREAAELFKPAGRKPVVNALVADVRAKRGELRQLRSEAEMFMSDQERLGEMERQSEVARALRDAARERSTELAVAVERADEKLAAIAAQEEALLGLRRERRQLQDEVAQLECDEALLAAAPELDALLDEAAGHARALESLSESEVALVRAETRASDALARTGLTAEVLVGLGDVHERAVEVEEARDELQRLELQCESREESAKRAADVQAKLEVAQVDILEPLGIGDDPVEAIGERLSALDALESIRGREGVLARRGVDVPSIVMGLSGVIAALTGVVLEEWVTVGIGVVLIVAGLVFALRARPGASALPGAEEREYLDMLGLEPGAGALEVSRARRALEAARSAVRTTAAAAVETESAARDAALARDALEARRALWTEWLSVRGLDAGLTGAGAASLLALVREARSAESAAVEIRQAHAHASGQLDSFAVRFASSAAPFMSIPEPFARDDVPASANRLKELLAAARSGLARREEVARALLAIDSRVEAEEERASRAREELLDVLGRFDLAEQGTHEDLKVLHARAAREEIEATAAFDELARAKHELAGRLETGTREKRVGELHLEEAGLAQRLGEEVERYLALAVSARLLEMAQERYTKERQPDVVRSAGELFNTMTSGRYVNLNVPLGEGRIEVFDGKADVRTSEILSRGTAEQLYLSIRLGLISQLGDVASGLPVLMDDVVVNFDRERRLGAVEAIASLAASRQVVFFTCHKDTADMFASSAPAHTRLEIPRL
ncbi:MAG: AAA family ATPase [Coriobacteriia bacterium]|nr:AAA family ATPase [Coriobacteriia bacterium]